MIAPASPRDTRPLVAHIVFRFGVGGLENGIVNLVNRLPRDRFRHAIIAMTEVTDFQRRIERDDVQYYSLHKPPGQGLKLVPRMRELLLSIQPDIVHTRNLGALEMSVAAAWAGVPVRIHGEHGWDSSDPDGRSLKYRMVRRAFRPFVHRYVALSHHLERYLIEAVGVPPHRVTYLCNGVDTARFRPPEGGREPIAGAPFGEAAQWVVGTVGRLHAIKDQLLLAQGFVRALQISPSARRRLRLVIAGDGPLRPALEQLIVGAGVSDAVWLAGERSDVPALMRGLDGFVLPSRAEGISNTVLEAMATGLPVTATAVGGNVELIDDGNTGRLVPAGDVEAMARALLDDLEQPDSATARGRRARAAVLARFSLDGMVAAYANLYAEALSATARPQALAQGHS